MKCQVCGATFPDDAHSCPGCGASGEIAGVARRDETRDESGEEVDSGVTAPVDRHRDSRADSTEGDGEAEASRPEVPADDPPAADSRTRDSSGAGSEASEAENYDAGAGGSEIPGDDRRPVETTEKDEEFVRGEPGAEGGTNTGEEQQPGKRGGDTAQSAGGSGGNGGGGGSGGNGGSEPTRRGSSARSLGPEVGPIEAKLRELPLFAGAFGGFIVVLLMLLVSGAIALAIPTVYGWSTIELTTVALFDLQFATPGHLTQAMFQRFQVVRPPDATLGLLYLLAPVWLYSAGKLVTRTKLSPDDSLLDAVMTGTTVLLGYFPLVLVAALLLPGASGSSSPSFLTAIGIAGILYPLVFGALGGFVGGYYTQSDLHVGSGYGVGAILLVLVGTFLTSFVFLDAGGTSIDQVTRLLIAIFTVVAVHALEAAGSQGNTSVLPYLVVALVVLSVGFFRAWRSRQVLSAYDGATRALTVTGTYLVLLGVLVTTVPLLSVGYIQQEVGLGFVGQGIATGVAQQSLTTVGEFVNLVLLGTILFPILLGGIGGAIAGYYRTRELLPPESSPSGAGRSQDD